MSQNTSGSDACTWSYTVVGMTCEHCVSSVTEEVGELAGVTNVDVALETGALTITTAGAVDPDAFPAAVEAAVREAGYRIS